MSDFLKALVDKAEANLAQAQQDVLGFRSSPGIDIDVKATNPVSGDRILLARTTIGQAFLNKFYFSRTIPLAELSKFAKLTHEWGLSINTIWEPEEL